MAGEGQGTLVALDPDLPAARVGRGGAARATSRGVAASRAEEQIPEDPAASAMEATLSLEPLRLPIATMVKATLRDEREALGRLGTDLRTELDQLREWRAREEAMRADQTALYQRAAEEWRGAGEGAAALHTGTGELATATRELRSAVDAAGSRFWRRAMLAAWLLSLVGLGLVIGLCGVVWLAVAHR